MFLRTPAKVNLFLEVVANARDGYHELTTLMLAVSLYDTLEIREVEVTRSGWLRPPDLSTGPDNLVCRAAELLREAWRPQGPEIRLWKRIPMAAGLGGGSTDAAATLAGLNAPLPAGAGSGRTDPAWAASWAAMCPSSSPRPRPGVRAGERCAAGHAGPAARSGAGLPAGRSVDRPGVRRLKVPEETRTGTAIRGPGRRGCRDNGPGAA